MATNHKRNTLFLLYLPPQTFLLLSYVHIYAFCCLSPMPRIGPRVRNPLRLTLLFKIIEYCVTGKCMPVIWEECRKPLLYQRPYILLQELRKTLELHLVDGKCQCKSWTQKQILICWIRKEQSFKASYFLFCHLMHTVSYFRKEWKISTIQSHNLWRKKKRHNKTKTTPPLWNLVWGAKNLLPDYKNMAFTLMCSSFRVSGKEGTVCNCTCAEAFIAQNVKGVQNKAKTSVQTIVQE